MKLDLSFCIGGLLALFLIVTIINLINIMLL